MTNKQTTNSPLWRELNEARTQGTLIVDGDMIICTNNPETYPKDYNDGIVVFETATAENTTDEGIVAHFAQQSANKRYTALAVNNFASLAEVLGNFIEVSEQRKEYHSVFEAATLKRAKDLTAAIS